MGQASVLTDAEIRKVFRIIETTRHAERNMAAFVLSIYAGLRVGEIAALNVGDVLTGGDEGHGRDVLWMPFKRAGLNSFTRLRLRRYKTGPREWRNGMRLLPISKTLMLFIVLRLRGVRLDT